MKVAAHAGHDVVMLSSSTARDVLGIQEYDEEYDEEYEQGWENEAAAQIRSEQDRYKPAMKRQLDFKELCALREEERAKLDARLAQMRLGAPKSDLSSWLHPSDVKICLRCGGNSYQNLILTCFACGQTSHCFCLNPPRLDMTLNEIWRCKTCAKDFENMSEVLLPKPDAKLHQCDDNCEHMHRVKDRVVVHNQVSGEPTWTPRNSGEVCIIVTITSIDRVCGYCSRLLTVVRVVLTVRVRVAQGNYFLLQPGQQQSCPRASTAHSPHLHLLWSGILWVSLA